MVLVIVYNFHIPDASLRPNKTDAVFAVDADRMLALAASLQGLKPVARRNTEIVEFPCDFELLKFSQGHPLDVSGQVRRFVALMNPFGGLASKGNYHPLT
jgi:hypothetical protein